MQYIVKSFTRPEAYDKKGGRTMPVMDEFKEEREALKHGTPKQKWQYFLDYYKWFVIVGVLILIFAGSFIYQLVTRKDRAIFVALLNVYDLEDAETYPEKFAEYAGIDPEEYDIYFDSSMHMDSSNLAAVDENTMATTQKLMVYIAAQEIDILVASESTINSYAYNETFYDLSSVLSEEQYEKYEPYFYYMDQSIADARNEADTTGDDYVSVPDYPSPRNPEAMENPIPVGIYLDEAEDLKENYYFMDETVILGIPANTQHLENAVQYIDFIFQ